MFSRHRSSSPNPCRLPAADFLASSNFSPATDVFAATRHPEFGSKRLPLQISFQYLPDIARNEGNELNPGGLEHDCRFCRNRATDDKHNLLRPQYVHQFQWPFRIKGEMHGADDGAAVDLGDQQGAG